MKKTVTAGLVLFVFFLSDATGAPLADIFKEKRLMVIVNDAGKAEDFTGYAESILKKKLKEGGVRIINPELITEVQKNRMLQEAIRNANASQLAAIATDYGADVLIHCHLSVDVNQKFAASWEGSASLSLVAINTDTAEELINIGSDPLGTTANPAPIEDSPLIAKQMSVLRVIDNILIKIGVLKGASDVSGVTTIHFSFYDAFEVGSQIPSAVFSDDGRRLFVVDGGVVQAISLLEKTVEPLFTPDGSITAITSMGVAGRLAAADHRGNIYLTGGSAGPSLQRIRAGSRHVSALAFHPQINMLASAGSDNNVYLYNVLAGHNPSAMKGHRGTVTSLAFAPNGRNLISAGEDLTVRWWDINVKRETKAMQESTDKLLCMALSQDGEMIALSTVDIVINMARRMRTDIRHIKVRRTSTGEEVRAFKYNRKADITALAFHPNKRFLASGSQDGYLNIWDVQQGGLVTSFELDDEIRNVAFDPKGGWFAAGTNRKVGIWKLN